MVIRISVWLLMYSTKFTPRLTFIWWIGKKDPVHQICMQEPASQVPSVCSACTISLALIWYHTCRANGMHQIWTPFWRVSARDTNGVFGDIGATHTHLMEAVQSFVRVVIDIHDRGLAPVIHVWKATKKFRTCWCISWKPLCCNPHESRKSAKAASTGSVFVRLGYLGWKPCTCYPQSTSRTRCSHRCHYTWLCSTGKTCSTQYNFYHHYITCMIVCNCTCSDLCRNPIKTRETKSEIEHESLKRP